MESKVRHDVNLPYSMSFLVERYGITQQAINKFVNKNIKKINKDGEHARKVGKEWRFDDVALNIIDYLKDKKKDENLPAIGSYESPEAIRIKELEAEVERLAKENADVINQNNALIITNGTQATLLNQANAKVEELEPKALLLSAAEADLVKKDDKIAELWADGQRKDMTITELEAENEKVRKAYQATQKALDAERSKSLWQLLKERLF